MYVSNKKNKKSWYYSNVAYLALFLPTLISTSTYHGSQTIDWCQVALLEIRYHFESNLLYSYEIIFTRKYN